MIKQKLEDIKKGKLTAEYNVKQFLEKINADDKKGNKINAFIELNENALNEAKKIDKKIKGKKAGKLAGIVFSVKSNILTKPLKATCASKVLENFKSPYNASVIEKLKAEDAIVIGMVNMDEFASGSSGETSAFGVTQNPSALGLIPGGSCSGSAAAVAADFCDFSLGSDTGGSIRNPASHCGVVGLKPSYGAVSRYGLIDLAMSFDQIGPLTKTTEDAELIFDIIKGKDEKDPTTIDFENEKIKEKIKIGIPKISIQDKRINELITLKVKQACEKFKWQEKQIEIKLIDLAIQTYYPIVYVEFFSGTRKFDGRRFGRKIEEHCGGEVLRRILGGSHISKAEYAGKYYRKALEARSIIKKEFESAFKNVDCIILPTVPRLPHKIGSEISVEEMYSYDTLTVPANLAGICSLNLPVGKIDNIPVGMQIMCNSGNEAQIFEIAKKFEELE